jgi:phosphatidate cytidylyltransferase
MLRQRIITAGIFGLAITAALLYASPAVAASTLGVLWLAGAWEWGGFAKLGLPARLLYTALFAVALALGWRWLDMGAARIVLVVALAWWAVALALVISYPRRFGAAFVAVAGVVVLWPSYVLLVRLHDLGGASLAFSVLLIVWAADVGAYVFGRLLGRTKLAPAVSPGKTWEGVTGGLLLAGVAAGAIAAWVGLPADRLVVLGVVTASVSVLGDLTQSMFKRNVGLKDSGKLLPGHGGVLDRIDSLTAAVPTFVGGLVALGLAP